jgi:hypothetical protein
VGLGLTGCGGGKGDVSGTVTYNHQPIPWGRITFLCEGGRKPALSSSIRNGSYKISNCPVGLVQIGVESFPARARVTKDMPPQMLKSFQAAGTEEPPPEAIGKHLEIPSRYADPTQSELEYTVQRGVQNHDISLTFEPPPEGPGGVPPNKGVPPLKPPGGK